MPTLRQRATALAVLREFFAARGVMEVETPHIVRAPVSDPQVANVRCALSVQPGVHYYLHTSPEYHMKRLLAAGAPDIYQVCRAFRDGEHGHRHLPEFTLVEWYRAGMSYGAFIVEACQLISAVAAGCGHDTGAPQRAQYRDLFLQATGLDPLDSPLVRIREAAGALVPGGVSDDLARGLGSRRTAWLDLLMVSCIEPRIRAAGLLVVDGYPADQAALARLDPGDPRIARRFEIFLHGVELANGFHELSDAVEQRRRFESDRQQRRQAGLPDAVPDRELLAALDAGLPDCCGVALGFDRLLMACLGLGTIDEAVSFSPLERASIR